MFLLFEASILGLWHTIVNSSISLTLFAVLIVVLLAVDVVLPTPSSIISITAAVTFGTIIGSILIFVGMSICCLFGYYLGRSGHSIFNYSSVYSTMKVDQSYDRWIKKWGAWSLLISRPIPVMAETSIVMAGITHFPFKRFLLFTIPANAAVSIAYGLFGFF